MKTVSVPAEAVNIYNRALEMSNKGDFATALTEYKRACELHPQFIEAFNNIGEIHASMGNSDLALKAYNDALKIGKNYRVLLNIGVECFNSGNHNDALGYFLDSVTLRPDFLESNYYAGLVYHARKEYDDAVKYFENVLEIDAQHYRANYLMAHICYDTGEYKKAIAHLDRISPLAEDRAFIDKFYGFCHYYLGDYKKAVKFLSEALSNQPGYSEFKSYLEGLTYENRMKEIGDIDKAIKDLEKSLKKEDETLSKVSRLSMLYIFKGENRKAEKLLTGYRDKIAS